MFGAKSKQQLNDNKENVLSPVINHSRSHSYNPPLFDEDSSQLITQKEIFFLLKGLSAKVDNLTNCLKATDKKVDDLRLKLCELS